MELTLNEKRDELKNGISILMPQIENKNGINVVSSRVIANELGKQHKHVLESIEKLISDSTAEISALFIQSTYVASNGKTNKEYLLTKDGFTLYMFNIQGYNDFKMAYINEFNKMEQALKTQYQVPTNFKEALQLALKQQEEIEVLTLTNKVQEQQIQELQPKATYYDLVLQCKDLIAISVIAKDYGTCAKELNKKLHELGVQYQVNKVWLLYAKYQDKGYTGTKTHIQPKPSGEILSIPHTYWTQKGRLFLYDLLKKEGILPMIERKENNVE